MLMALRHKITVDRTKPLSHAPNEGHNRWHPDIPSACKCRSGDTVEIATRDSFDCQICATTTADDLKSASLTRAHPLSGPVFVEDAEPGDLLAVHIEEVRSHDEGFTAIMPGFGFLRDMFPQPHIVHWQMRDGFAQSPQLPNIRIPGAPFMGVMGLAPSRELLAQIKQREAALLAKGGAVMMPEPSGAIPSHEPLASEAIRTIAPHETGGNLDIRHLVAGSTLYLPVYVEGGLFSTGDAHFAQGDGESCGTAIETSAVLVAKFELLKGEAARRRQKDASFGSSRSLSVLNEARPFYATTGTCVSSSGENFSEDISLATRNALLNMLRYLVDQYKMTEAQAYSLISVAVNLRISQIVDVPNVTVSAFLPTDIFLV
jgi:formamidase